MGARAARSAARLSDQETSDAHAVLALAGRAVVSARVTMLWWKSSPFLPVCLFVTHKAEGTLSALLVRNTSPHLTRGAVVVNPVMEREDGQFTLRACPVPELTGDRP